MRTYLCGTFWSQSVFRPLQINGLSFWTHELRNQVRVVGCYYHYANQSICNSATTYVPLLHHSSVSAHCMALTVAKNLLLCFLSDHTSSVSHYKVQYYVLASQWCACEFWERPPISLSFMKMVISQINLTTIDAQSSADLTPCESCFIVEEHIHSIGAYTIHFLLRDYGRNFQGSGSHFAVGRCCSGPMRSPPAIRTSPTW